MHVCVCTYFSAGGGLSKQAEGKNGRKAVLPYFAKSETVSLRRRFSQTALEITTTLPFKVAKQSQALGTWGEESSHICSFTLSQMPRFLLFTLYHGAERGKLTKIRVGVKRENFCYLEIRLSLTHNFCINDTGY